MIEDIHEPVENYKSFFKDAHARNATAFFEDLVKKSAVDEAANIQTVKELRVLEQKVTNESSLSRNWRILRGVTIALLVIGICFILIQYSNWWMIGLALVLGPPIYKLRSGPGNLNKPISGESATFDGPTGRRDGAEDGKKSETDTLSSVQGQSGASGPGGR